MLKVFVGGSALYHPRLGGLTASPKPPSWTFANALFMSDQPKFCYLHHCLQSLYHSILTLSESCYQTILHSFLQGWNCPFSEGTPPPFWVAPSFWSKSKTLPPSFWRASKLVHVNCMKNFKMKVLCFVL